jgi:hypothetical protein
MYLKNEKGAALLFVIIIFSVLMVFASAIIGVWGAEGMTAIRQEKQVKARYSAQSVANSVAKFIGDANNSDDPFVLEVKGLAVGEFLSTSSVSANPMSKSSLDVTVSRVSEDKIEVYATSHVDGVAKNATLIMSGSGIDEDLIFDDLVYADGTLHLKGFDSIEGDITYGETLTGDNESCVNGSITEESINFSEPKLPKINDTHIGTVSTKDYPIMNSYDGDMIDELEIVNGKPLKFNPHTDGQHVWILVVNNFEIKKGGFDIPDGDKLIIYIKPGGEFNISTPNADPIDDANKLVIMAMEGSEVNIDANSGFKGFIYGPSADVNIKTPNIQFDGAIISNDFNVTLNGNSAANTTMNYEAFDDSSFEWNSYIESDYKKDHWE